MTEKEKTLPTYSVTEEKGKDQHWLINGSLDFAVIPAGTIPNIEENMPIRLPVGDKKYGAIHILEGHRHWVMKTQPDGCVATLVHRKLSQSGRIFTTESSGKLALVMKLSPEAFMVLRRAPGCFSVTTLYSRPRQPDGVELARYMGNLWATHPYKQTPL